MKLAFPLSLKVSLWLILNLCLLAVLGIGIFQAQVGFGWNTLIGGAAGERLQGIAHEISADIQATPRSEWDAVLARFNELHGAEFSLFLNDGQKLAGVAGRLPPPVAAQLNRRSATDGDRQPARPPPPQSERPRPDRPPQPGRVNDSRAGRAPGGDGARGRFLIRAGRPPAYWVGLRTPPPARGEDALPGPTTVLVHVPDVRTLVRLLDLQAWLVGAGGLLALSVLFWIPLVRSITRALNQLTVATERIAEGRFETRVDVGRRDELGRLGQAVNRMAARLDTLVNGQKRFLSDAAHELCSPLARLQLAVGILEERADPALRVAVADVRDEVQQMSALVNELLAFSKAGLRPREAALTAVALQPLVAKMLERENAADLVTVDIAPTLWVGADPAPLARALGNLVRNALRYAEGTPITLTAARLAPRALSRGQAPVTIVIADAGPGVPEEALARLGEPFFRPDVARTRETGGVGLGLSIVKSCVEACQGRVTFANRQPHGFVATVELTAATPPVPASVA